MDTPGIWHRTSRTPENARSDGDAGTATFKSSRLALRPLDEYEIPDPRDWLAAIIAGSDDAIIGKDLDGTIRSWNCGATRLFGYTAEEVVGLPITVLIPEDRLDEEPHILSQISQGKHIEHFETQRRHKDGSLLDLSLTISPIRNARGAIVGASKIARDIALRRQAQEKQQLLFGEMQHRIKNLFALTAGIVSLTARSEDNIANLVQAIHERLTALARAYELTMPNLAVEAHAIAEISLPALLHAILRPYEGQDRITVKGDDLKVSSKALTDLALLLHELATNAAKYGSLSVPEGRLDLSITKTDVGVQVTWIETCGPQVSQPEAAGFGSRLERSLAAALSATLERNWRPEGLSISMLFPLEKFTD